MAHSRKILTALACTVACGAAAAPAGADSIVYAKEGNLFLTSPDGAHGYQLTHDGGYSSPSQADDGTIGAVRDKQLVRLDRSGRILSAFDVVGTPGTGQNINGPWEARLSPDGTRFAYWFYVQSSYYDYGDDHSRPNTGKVTAITASDHFQDPTTESEHNKSLTQAEWVADDRLLGTQDFWMNMWTWQTGTGTGYTWTGSQFWFGLQDEADEWGVEAYHWYQDPALSPDGSKLAMTDQGKRLLLATTNGPAWSGNAPYPEDYDTTEPFPRPTIQCHIDGDVVNPSWSRDNRTLAFGGSQGVMVLDFTGSSDCSQVTGGLVAPGGTEPAFGPADVNMGQAPRGEQPGPGDHGAQPAGVTISGLKATPRRRAAKVTFTLSAPAKVVATIGRRKVEKAAKAGANSITIRRLKRGRHRVTLTAMPNAGGAPATATLRVRVKG